MSGPKTFGHGAPTPGARQELAFKAGISIPIILRRPLNLPENPDVLQHFEADAMIDTGSSVTVVDISIARSLGLVRTGQTEVNVVGGKAAANTYACVVEVPQLGHHQLMQIWSPRNPIGSSMVLLGRDFLRHYVFTYDGRSGLVTFANAYEAPVGPVDDE